MDSTLALLILPSTGGQPWAALFAAALLPSAEIESAPSGGKAKTHLKVQDPKTVWRVHRPSGGRSLGS